MPLTIGKPYLDTKEEVDRFGRKQKKYRICVMVHNPTNAEITKCWTIYFESTSRNPQNTSVPEAKGKFELRAKVTGQFGTITDGDMLCTEFWPARPSDTKFYVWIGDTKNAQGFVEPGAGNVRSEPLILQSRLVRARAGSKVSYSALVGAGIVEDLESDAVTIDVLNALPKGWTLDVPEQIGVGDFEFTVRPRAGADDEEFGVIEVRTFVEGNDSPIDETSVTFMAESALKRAAVTESDRVSPDFDLIESISVAPINGNGRDMQVANPPTETVSDNGNGQTGLKPLT